MLPRNQNYVTICKRQIRHLDASMRGQKTVEFFGLQNNFCLRPVVPVRQFPPNGFEAEFGQTPLCSVGLD